MLPALCTSCSKERTSPQKYEGRQTEIYPVYVILSKVVYYMISYFRINYFISYEINKVDCRLEYDIKQID